MRLLVSNLGCIKTADIEITPLTVLIGPPNTNKTWTAYSLYGLVRSAIVHRSIASEYSKNVWLQEPLNRNIDAAVKQLLAALTAVDDAVSTSAEVSRSQLLDGVAFPLRVNSNQGLFEYVLDMDSQTLGSPSATLEISEKETRSDLATIAFTLERDGQSQLLTTLSVDKSGGEAKTAARLPLSQNAPLLESTIRPQVRNLVAATYGNVIAFPAERKALNSLYSIAIRAIRGDRGPTKLSRPVIDFITFLEGAQFSGSNAARSGSSSFSSLADELEQRVLGGNVSFESDSGRLPRMEYRTPGRNPIGVHAASSLVKSLGALDIYLRMFVQENDLVIIDEPEMNAHPDAQLAIAELLAILVNRGVGVVITTHSPYIVDHLKNLMEIAASKPKVRDAFASRLKLGSAKAFISADKVSVYLFNSDGTVAPILNREERLIDWSTFSNASEEVTNLYADVLEANRTE